MNGPDWSRMSESVLIHSFISLLPLYQGCGSGSGYWFRIQIKTKMPETAGSGSQLWKAWINIQVFSWDGFGYEINYFSFLLYKENLKFNIKSEKHGVFQVKYRSEFPKHWVLLFSRVMRKKIVNVRLQIFIYLYLFV